MTARALLLAALLALPFATAHIETPAAGQGIQVGPYSIFLDPRPTPLFANASNQQVNLDFGSPPGRAVNATLQITGPNGFQAVAPFEPFDVTRQIAKVQFAEPGEHAIRLVVEDDRGRYLTNLFFRVYPDLPFRLRSVDANQDIAARTSTTLAFETVHPILLDRIDAVPDLELVVDHMSPDHQRLLDSVSVEAPRVDKGLFRVEHVFAQEGHYYIKFQSRGGGFNTSDVPILHLTAMTSVPSATAKTPAPPAWALAAALAAAALAWSATRAGRPRR